MMSMLLWWGGNAYVGCSMSSRSVSAGAVGFKRKGGKRSADGGLKYCGNVHQRHARHGQ